MRHMQWKLGRVAGALCWTGHNGRLLPTAAPRPARLPEPVELVDERSANCLYARSERYHVLCK
jgi:hypothetical protein